MMKLTRAGIGVAIAGGIALAVHGMLLAKPAPQRSDRDLYEMLLARQAQQRSDCAAWHAAREANEDAHCGLSTSSRTRVNPNHEKWIVTNALDDPDMEWLLEARVSLARCRELLSLLLPALRDPSFVGLRDAGDVTVEGRNMPLHDHGTIVREDLFTRAGRASWLLKQATGHPAPIVGVQTNPRLLVDISNDWHVWLVGLEGGDTCFPAETRPCTCL